MESQVYKTEAQVVANSLGSQIECKTCDRKIWLPDAAKEPLIAVKKPRRMASLKQPFARKLEAVKEETTLSKMSAAVAQSPLFHCGKEEIPLEIRRKIWAEVVKTDSEVGLVTWHICPHIDAVDVRVYEQKPGGNTDCHDHPGAAILMVSKKVQMEVLEVLLNTSEITVADSQEPSWSGALAVNTNDNRYAGWEVLMSTFRPFCKQIRQLRVVTPFDTDCIDIEPVPQGRFNRSFRTAGDGRTFEPQTQLLRSDLSNIFSNLRSLTIHIDALDENEDSRVMPRYLARDEFEEFFRGIKGFKLEYCDLEWSDQFGRTSHQRHLRMLGRKSHRKIQWKRYRRREGLALSRTLRRELRSLAVDTLKENNLQEGYDFELEEAYVGDSTQPSADEEGEETDDYDCWYSDDHYPSKVESNSSSNFRSSSSDNETEEEEVEEEEPEEEEPEGEEEDEATAQEDAVPAIVDAPVDAGEEADDEAGFDEDDHATGMDKISGDQAAA